MYRYVLKGSCDDMPTCVRFTVVIRVSYRICPECARARDRYANACGTRIFACLPLQTNSPYALKILQKAQVCALRQQKNVMNEKNIMARMNHPFILKLAATFKDEYVK